MARTRKPGSTGQGLPSVGVRLKAATLRSLDREARKTGRTRAELVREFIEERLRQKRPPKQVQRYRVILQWDPDTNLYAVTVPALGCATYGSTRAHALAMAQEAIEVTIEDLKEVGLPVPVDDARVFVEDVEVAV